ncbi:MAG: proprotein convertase P-domain-containing protein [Planctomycetota bacterium]
MSKKLIHLMALVLVLAVAGTTSAGQTIAIVNPGFEDPVLDEDGWTWLDIPGWTLVGAEGSGVWNVTINDFDPVIAPEGENVLYTENAVGDAGGAAQVLTETFAADTDYTLTVEVGNSYYYYNGGYSVQLLAGETVIAEDNDTLWPDYKAWATSTVAYTYDPADAGLVGQPLEIRLLNLGLDKDSPPADTAVGVEFDNVTLSSAVRLAKDPNPADDAIAVSHAPVLDIYVSDDVPKNIQDLQPTTPMNTLGKTTSVLTIPGSTTITDLNVELDITMPGNNADLNVFLKSPDGKQVELFTDVGFNLDDFKNTILDDEASKSIRDGTQPFTGTFKPEGRLADFDGRDTAGDWVLTIYDDWRGDTGTLNSWKLVVESVNILSWVPGDNIASQDVYISKSFDDVNDSTDAAFQGNFAADVSTFGIDLELDQTYFWRIDSLDADGMVIGVGDIWSFATAPDPIFVDPSSDLAAENELAKPGGIIYLAEGTYVLTSQIEVKDGVTYQGAGAGLTIIDGNDVTRAFAAWGDRGATNGQVDENGNAVPNLTGPTRWVIDGMTIQNCVSDTENRQDILSAARDLLNNYTGSPYTLEAAQAENGGIADNPEWFDLLSGGADDDLTDAELQAYLDTNPVGSDGHLVVNDDKNDDGGAITIHNAAVGTIANCEFLNNYTPAGGGGDGGAINITGLSVVTLNDCLFDGNYAVSPDSVAVDDSDGDGGHIRLQGSSASAVTAGTTLNANRCTFLNGNAEDDGGAIMSGAVGSIIRLDACWFEGNTSWDNGNVLFIGNESSGELTATNCVFANNITKADNSPDRMCQVRRNSRFVNCTFVGNNQEDQDLIYNNANNADTDADGTDDESADATQVINCIFLNNVVGNGDHVLGSRNANFTIAAINCLFFGNTLQDGNAADNTQRPAEEVGTIDVSAVTDAAEIVVDPAGDYHLAAGSPAIDASDPDTATATDIEGTEAVGARDVGAYEAPEAPEEAEEPVN